jgi:hypothetical protein
MRAALRLQDGFLHSPAAAGAPRGDGHLLDEARFDGAGGLKMLDVGFVQGSKYVPLLEAETHDGVEKLVADGVAGRTRL